MLGQWILQIDIESRSTPIPRFSVVQHSTASAPNTRTTRAISSSTILPIVRAPLPGTGTLARETKAGTRRQTGTTAVALETILPRTMLEPVEASDPEEGPSPLPTSHPLQEDSRSPVDRQTLIVALTVVGSLVFTVFVSLVVCCRVSKVTRTISPDNNKNGMFTGSSTGKRSSALLSTAKVLPICSADALPCVVVPDPTRIKTKSLSPHNLLQPNNVWQPNNTRSERQLHNVWKSRRGSGLSLHIPDPVLRRHPTSPSPSGAVSVHADFWP
ncbi:hypothetical protein SeMB42_g04909 [Synchytrium endobioticum]|uniref:Uncharacterized protein n=1 Tax=Synchytrium endobioticum TaxID=286115 RepID=A0A507CV03_9FUNG|nr:hypothetical protein SeMB42_g04909 [Synchytrium endobioticum]